MHKKFLQILVLMGIITSLSSDLRAQTQCTKSCDAEYNKCKSKCKGDYCENICSTNRAHCKVYCNRE